MKRMLLMLCALASAPLPAERGAAQTAGQWSVQGSLTGNLFIGAVSNQEREGLLIASPRDALGFELQLRRQLTPRFSLGVGADYTLHAGHSDPPALSTLEDTEHDIRRIGVVVEPRWTLATSTSALIYGALRAGVSRTDYPNVVVAQICNSRLCLPGESETYEVGDVESSWGYTANIGAGMIFMVGERVHIDTGLSLGLRDLGDVEVTPIGEGSPASARGSYGALRNAVIRFGFIFLL